MPRGDGPIHWLFRLGHADPAPADEVRWEIEHYVAEQTDRLVEAGWDPEEARREAERRFGPESRYRSKLERMRKRRRRMMRMGAVVETLGESLRDTGRAFKRSPAFAAGVVLTLGLGLGANAAMFAIVDRLLLRPPDHIVDADRVLRVGVTRASSRGGRYTQYSLAFPDVLDLETASTFETATYGYPDERTLGSGPDAISVTARDVSHDFFSLLGVSMVRGRAFSEEDDRVDAPRTVVLGHGLWSRRFGADPDVLGRSIELGGEPHTVIGVAPEGFTGVTLEPVDLWLPTRSAGAEGDQWASRSWYWIAAVVRLRDGASLSAARDEATALHRGGRADAIADGRYDADVSVDLGSLITASGSAEGRVTKWLLGVAFVVLLIACANVANLLLARGARRRRESAVRLALGVSRLRLAGQRGAEALLLSLVGGALALLIGSWGAGVLAAVLLPDVLFTSVLNGRVVGFTVVVSLLAGVLAGVGPAVQGTGRDVQEALAAGSRTSSARPSALRGLLVVTQAALSVVLLVGAGLFVRSLDEVESLDLGLDVDRLALAQLELATDGLTAEEETALYLQAAEHLRRLPSVRAATVTHAPFRSSYSASVRVPGRDSMPSMPGGGPYYFAVGESYFETMGLEILEGRAFEPSDRKPTAESVTVVSRNMADSLWDGDALGGCLLVGTEDSSTCFTVVGVVEDASRGSLSGEPYFAWYLPISRSTRRARGLYVRLDGEPRELKGDVALALRSFSPQVRFARVQALREILDPQARSWSLGATMFTLFGLLALVVAGVGLYSLLAFGVEERTRELSIRTALGAARVELLRSVVARGTRLVVPGVVLGLGVAWLSAPYVEDLLFRVDPRDPGVLGGVVVTLGVVALAASLIPGWRATRIDPMEALKAE